MGNLDAVLKRYYRSIRRELPCSRKVNKQIMEQIHNSVNLFLEQNPDADIDAVRAHFGEPQTIALSYIEDQDAPELLRKMNIKRKVLTVVVAVLTVALLIWTAAVIGTALDSKNTHGGYINVDIGEE